MNENNLVMEAERIYREKNWHKVRIFLSDLEQSSKDMSSEEIRYLLPYCYELLFHEKRAARTQAAHTFGILLSYSGDEMQKLWEGFSHRILFGKHQTEEQIRWIGLLLKQIMNAALELMGDEEKKILISVYVRYFKSSQWDFRTCQNLLIGILDIDVKDLTPLQRHEIFGFMRGFLSEGIKKLSTLSLFLLKKWRCRGWIPQEDEQRFIRKITVKPDDPYSLKYLLGYLCDEAETKEAPETQELIRRNLDLSDDGITKMVYLDIIKSRAESLPENEQSLAREKYALHLFNIMRLDDHPLLYFSAEELLVEVAPALSEYQVYDLFRQMLKTVEMNIDSSNFSPYFLGKTFRYLNKKHKQEFVYRIRQIADFKDTSIVMTNMETICIILSEAEEYGYEVPLAHLLVGALKTGLCCYKKELSVETEFLIRKYGLGKIWQHEEESLKQKEKLAYFTGAFDPFTLKDKAIVQELLDMGFGVILSVNDFEWKMNAQPIRIRRQMLTQSVADFQDVMVLPEEVSICPLNDNDLRQLKDMFPGQEIFLVTDVSEVEKAVGYEQANWPHVVYFDSGYQGYADRVTLEQILNNEICYLKIPAQFLEVSSETVKQRIMEGFDLTGYVDVQVQNTIQEWNLYKNFEIFRKTALPAEHSVICLDNSMTISDRDEEGNMHCAYAKWKIAGKTAVILEIKGDMTETTDYCYMVMLEVLAYFQKIEISHVVCFDADKYGELLSCFGFVRMNEYEDGMTLDMSHVIVIFFDAESILKEPFKSNKEIRHVIGRNRKKLLRSLVNVFPGTLVLGLPIERLNDRLIELIRKDITTDDKVCVPFGKILRGALIRDAVTIELHTEKMYQRDLDAFEIKELPNYASLSAQIRGIKSVGRQVMLVDDFFHKGYRFEKIQALMENEDLKIANIITGVLSGNGQKIARERGLSIEAAYNISNMKIWLLESDLYPFVGGDGLELSDGIEAFDTIIPSMNTILPYQMPSFFKRAEKGKIYELSEVCLENTGELYNSLEEIYYRNNHHILTLDKISEVMTEARCPADLAIRTFRHFKISSLIEDDKKKLRRLKNL